MMQGFLYFIIIFLGCIYIHKDEGKVMDSFKDEIECSIIKDIEDIEELISFPSKLKGFSDFYKVADMD